MVAPQQTFQDHIGELRRRFMWIILAIGLSAGIAYVLRARLINVLLHPLNSPVYYTSPAGSFNFVLKLSFVIGMFITLPVVIYQLLRFIEPALPIRISRGLMIKILGASFLLALIGIAFGFFLMVPMSLHFFGEYASKNVQPWISADEYLSFVINHMLTFAIAFQIPMIFLFINRIKPLKPSLLLKYQRHVVVGSFALAIILPFTYDPLSQFIVAIPIIFLYYLSIVLLWFANRKHEWPAEAVAEPIKPKPMLKPSPIPTPSPLPSPSWSIPDFAPKRPAFRPVLAMDGFVKLPAAASRNASPAIRASEPAPKPSAPQFPAKQKLPKRPLLSIDGVSPPLASSI